MYDLAAYKQKKTKNKPTFPIQAVLLYGFIIHLYILFTYAWA